MPVKAKRKHSRLARLVRWAIAVLVVAVIMIIVEGFVGKLGFEEKITTAYDGLTDTLRMMAPGRAIKLYGTAFFT
jgi:predicted anti-sigma-YlaC factor YlaD